MCDRGRENAGPENAGPSRMRRAFVVPAANSVRPLWRRGLPCPVRCYDAEDALVVPSRICSNARSCSGLQA